MIDWTCQNNRTMMVLLWLVHLTCSGPSCPKDLLSDVFSCLRNLTHGDNFSTMMSTIDVEHMQRNCRNGAFDDSVKCLGRVQSRFDQPEAKEWLEKLARPKRWEAGFQRFCKHINLYIEKTDCVHQRNTEAEVCINRNSEIFRMTNDFISHGPSTNSVEVDVVKSICSVFHWTDYCLNKPLGLFCGEPVGAIVTDFHGGITPPICIDYEGFNNSAKTFTVSKKIITILTLSYFVVLKLRYGIRI